MICYTHLSETKEHDSQRDTLWDPYKNILREPISVECLKNTIKQSTRTVTHYFC